MRLLKYSTRFGMRVVIPGWSPFIMELLRLLMSESMSERILSAFIENFGGSTRFAMEYVYYEKFSKFPIKSMGYDYDFVKNGASSAKARSMANEEESTLFPVPYRFGSDATPRCQRSGNPWVDAVSLWYSCQTLKKHPEMFFD